LLLGCASVAKPSEGQVAQAQAAKAESLYYQGYALVALKLTAVPDATKAYAKEIEEGWMLVQQAAGMGNAKALRGMGIYWSEKGDAKMARGYFEQAIAAGSMAAKYDLAAMTTGLRDTISSELQHAAKPSQDQQANTLLREAAQGGYPPAIRAWCAQNIPGNPYVPGTPEERLCDEWMEVGAAQGDWQSWGQVRVRYEDKQPLVDEAYARGLSKVRGGFTGMVREGRQLGLSKDSPFIRCVSFLGQQPSRFLFVFNEQLCVPPRSSFPKWRGLGKAFKAPAASAESEQWYQQGLSKLAEQQFKEGGALLKRAAEAGHTGAMINWALVQYSNDDLFYDNIVDQTDSPHVAWTWLEKAERAGDLRAKYLLSFFKDRGVREPLRQAKGRRQLTILRASRIEAERNEREAAEAGLARAQYLYGWHLVRDERGPEGWAWLQKAYANGERIAGFDLYRIARYIWRDNAQALQYLQSSAEEGELASAQLLSIVYGKGELGLKPDAAKAGCYAKVVEQHQKLNWEARQDLSLPGLNKRCEGS